MNRPRLVKINRNRDEHADDRLPYRGAGDRQTYRLISRAYVEQWLCTPPTVTTDDGPWAYRQLPTPTAMAVLETRAAALQAKRFTSVPVATIVQIAFLAERRLARRLQRLLVAAFDADRVDGNRWREHHRKVRAGASKGGRRRAGLIARSNDRILREFERVRRIYPDVPAAELYRRLAAHHDRNRHTIKGLVQASKRRQRHGSS